MRIGLISSYNERCGVAEYTKSLVEGLLEQGHEVKVAANYRSNRATEEDPEYVKRFFNIHFLNNSQEYDFHGLKNFLKDCEIIHVQFETNLYTKEMIEKLLEWQVLRSDVRSKVNIVSTMHSSGVWAGFYVEHFARRIAHTPMWCSTDVIPMPVRVYTGQDNSHDTMLNMITSFGLGRNNDDMVKEAISGLDFSYKPKFGTGEWLSRGDLISHLHDNYIITLIYPPVPGVTVSSSAACLALSVDRPLVVTNTEWFQGIINLPGVYPVEYGNTQQLRETLQYLSDPNNMLSIEADLKLRKEEIKRLGMDFDTYIQKHITLYKETLYA